MLKNINDSNDTRGVKMKILLIFLCFITWQISISKVVNLHFFIEPKFQLEAVEKINSSIKKHTHNDSIQAYHFFCGTILNKKHSDEHLIRFLNTLDCDFASPVDYQFTANQNIQNFKLISSNIQSSALKINQYELILLDSLKIGIITINSPDQFVKNKIDGKAVLDYDFFEKTQKIAKELQKKTNFIILLSNLSKEIDEDLTQNVPVDVVISFDYQSRPNGKLSNKRTQWYSSKANIGTMGTLQVQYEKGKVTHKWFEKKVTFR
jgi:2',3'-cyclic-nucleotide 2'-phosphodiesterase (5'-nucleotidase family)